jgi:hypothetical protein
LVALHQHTIGHHTHTLCRSPVVDLVVCDGRTCLNSIQLLYGAAELVDVFFQRYPSECFFAYINYCRYVNKQTRLQQTRALENVYNGLTAQLATSPDLTRYL